MRASFLISLTFAMAILAAPALAADKSVTGKIVSFECGDNCYLTIKPKSGGEINALCSVDLCASWYETQEMPAKFKGRKVKISLGTGKQVDGAGNDMGEYPEITKLTLVKK